MAEPVFDWQLRPLDQLFHVPGEATFGGMTLGGARTRTPMPGGRARLDLAFGKSSRDLIPEKFSWTASRIANGSLFRIPIRCSRQLVSYKALGIAADDVHPTSWDDGTSFSDGTLWEATLGVAAASASAKGSLTIDLDMSPYQHGLMYGHIIGHMGRAYLIDDIEYSGSTARVTVTPPLRREVLTGDFISFRPSMLGVCADPSSFRSLLVRGRWADPGPITFVEALI